MVFLRHALVLSTVLLMVTSSPTRPAPDQDGLQRMLENVQDSSIHAALHKYSIKFKDGVFSKDLSAIEQVHSEDPSLATKLIHMAKRQGNSTIVPVPTESVSSLATTAIGSATTASTAPTTAVGPATTASIAPTPPISATPIATSKGAVVFSSSGGGLVTVASSTAVIYSSAIIIAPTTPPSATPVATSNGAVIFRTAGGGLVTVSSSATVAYFTPHTSISLSTFTAPDGSVSTSTSVTVINAPVTGSVIPAPTGSAGSSPSATTSGGNPGLQSGAASATKGHLKEVALMMGGAAVVAMAL